MKNEKQLEVPEQNLPSEEEPQVFAVNKEGNNVKFTRRNFLELMAVTGAAVALNSCSLFQHTATLNSPRVKIYAGPNTLHPVIGTGNQGDVYRVISRTSDGNWILISDSSGNAGWVQLSYASLSEVIDKIPVENNAPTPPPTATSTPTNTPTRTPTSTPTRTPTRTPTKTPTKTPVPTGLPGNVPAGENGIQYSSDGQVFHLPCGAPIPEGAVCVCNCVEVPTCSCVGYTYCECDTVCTCESVCSCESVYHYWYPN
jgi:cell division septation protein DedD